VRSSRVLTPILIALSLAGAAAAQEGPIIFISPMGEPFRAKANEPYPSAKWFEGADANHDGVISKEEFRADALRFFKTLDVIKDGQINDLEVQNYEYRIAPEIIAATQDTSTMALQAARDDSGDWKHTGLFAPRQGAAYFSFLNDAEPVRSADADLNRKVTQDEWMAAANRRYDKLLADGATGLKLDQLPRPPNQRVK
jgi:hypothetical protein